MKRFLKSFHYGEGGFVLPELLPVLLAALIAAILAGNWQEVEAIIQRILQLLGG